MAKRPLTQSPTAKRKKREVVTWAAPENVFNQVNVHRLSALSRFDFAHGVDGSILADGDLVYVVNMHPLECRILLNYLHGQIPGHGPVAQMMDEDESDIYAYEMFSLRRSSSIVRAMTRLQRIWRRRRQQRVPVSIATNPSSWDAEQQRQEQEQQRFSPPESLRGCPRHQGNDFCGMNCACCRAARHECLGSCEICETEQWQQQQQQRQQR